MCIAEFKLLGKLSGRYDPVTDTGYMGVVPASEFITGKQLIDQLNFHEGVDQNLDAGWLKFYVGPDSPCNMTGMEKFLYIAKKSFKHSVTWDDIYHAELVHGTTKINVHGESYSVRLVVGKEFGNGAEWLDLVCRVNSECVDSDGTAWNLHNIDTNITNGHGRYTWGVKMSPSENGYKTRGILCGVVCGYYLCMEEAYKSTDMQCLGWRPVLELILG